MSVGFDLISKVQLTDWFAENTRCGMMHPARHREMTKLILSAFSWSLSASSSEFFTWKLPLKDKKHETYIELVQRRQFGWVLDCMWSRCIVVFSVFQWGSGLAPERDYLPSSFFILWLVSSRKLQNRTIWFPLFSCLLSEELQVELAKESAFSFALLTLLFRAKTR